MSRRDLSARIANLEAELGQAPIPSRVLDAAFKLYQSTGQLPEDERLAEGVIDRVRFGCET